MTIRRVKYQIFVSSTFSDLRDARSEVSWTILRLDHIPAGMEGFPATNDRGWEIIKRTIDDSDYYVLLIGGLYGSIDPAKNISWTEREYNYAKEIGLPVFAFIRRPEATPGNLVESTTKRRKLLERFISRVRAIHLYKPWDDVKELSGMVGEALTRELSRVQTLDTLPPRGWFRGPLVDQATSNDVTTGYSRTEPDLSALLESNLRLRINPLAVPGYQAFPSRSLYGKVANQDRYTITVSMPSVPFGRISHETGGAERHDLHGETPRADACIPRSSIDTAHRDSNAPSILDIRLRSPLTFGTSNQAWSV